MNKTPKVSPIFARYQDTVLKNLAGERIVAFEGSYWFRNRAIQGSCRLKIAPLENRAVRGIVQVHC